MNSVSAAQTARSVQAVNEVMQNATTKATEQAQKLVKVNAEMALGSEPGKGTNFEAIA